jgi:hypothetical protein
MLNLNQLALDGYDVTGCRWFRNSKQLLETHTLDEFSYSAGPNSTDLLELEPTYYSFQITTKSSSMWLNSTIKMLTEYEYHYVPLKSGLFVYPNPVYSGSSFKLEGAKKSSLIEVYNQYGVCVSRTVANEEVETLSLDLPVGVYIIRNDNKAVRITVIK